MVLTKLQAELGRVKCERDNAVSSRQVAQRRLQALREDARGRGGYDQCFLYVLLDIVCPKRDIKPVKDFYFCEPLKNFGSILVTT